MNDSEFPCKCVHCASEPSPTYLEAFRAACEARWVCLMPTLKERQDYLALVEKKRGAAARVELALNVEKHWPTRSSRSGSATP